MKVHRRSARLEFERVFQFVCFFVDSQLDVLSDIAGEYRPGFNLEERRQERSEQEIADRRQIALYGEFGFFYPCRYKQ